MLVAVQPDKFGQSPGDICEDMGHLDLKVYIKSGGEATYGESSRSRPQTVDNNAPQQEAEEASKVSMWALGPDGMTAASAVAESASQDEHPSGELPEGESAGHPPAELEVAPDLAVEVAPEAFGDDAIPLTSANTETDAAEIHQ